MSVNYFLKGEKIFLRPIEAGELMKLARLIAKWVNDEIVTYFMLTGQKPKSSAEIVADLKKQLAAGNNVIFLVSDSKTKKPIGYAGLYDMHDTARKAEFRILIGERKFWGKGYGTEIAEILCYYGFDRLNLNRIYLGYSSQNEGAGKAYKRAGYIYEGILKEDIYRNSRYYDTIRMAILRTDYYKKFHQLHSERFKQKISRR